MPWIPYEEHEKVPVVKNLIWATKTLIKADKWFLLSGIISEIATNLFRGFIQSVLFLKVLLTAITGEGDFKYYVKCLVAFLFVGVVAESISVWGDYVTNVGQKKIFKALNNMLFEKAASVDVSCYEDPAFYDKYQRATDILTRGYFVMFSWNLSLVSGSLFSLISIIGIVTTIDPKYLLFLAPVLLVFPIEIFKAKVVFKRDVAMTTNNRIKSYIQRTVFLKDFSKDMRTSNVFEAIMNRFENAIKGNIEIIKKYGLKLFIYSCVSSVFGEFVPVVGTYAYAGYEFVAKNNLDVSGFSVVLSSIRSVSDAAQVIARSFSDLNQVAFYFQNLRDFFEYEPQVVSGDLKAD